MNIKCADCEDDLFVPLAFLIESEQYARENDQPTAGFICEDCELKIELDL